MLRCRGFHADPTTANILVALRILAERHRDLNAQITTLTGRVDPLVTAANPALRAAHGVGPHVARQQRRAPDRAGPDVAPSTHHRLRPPPNRPRPLEEGDPADAETRHLPRDLPTPHPTAAVPVPVGRSMLVIICRPLRPPHQPSPYNATTSANSRPSATKSPSLPLPNDGHQRLTVTCFPIRGCIKSCYRNS